MECPPHLQLYIVGGSLIVKKMSLKIDKAIMDLFVQDKKATFRVASHDKWSKPKKIKDYVIGTFIENKNLTLCEITKSDGTVITLKP